MRPTFKRPLSDKNDKKVLFFSFFTGLILIILFRYILADNTSTSFTYFDWTAVIAAVGIIILYCIYILKTKDRSGLSVDRASDNAYYLGLLFTLVSLSISLIKLATTFNSESTETYSTVLILLPDFGLALFSTIAGIMGRIFLQQFRNDPLDIETEAREELGEAIRVLRSSIGTIVVNLNNLSEQTKVSLTELNNNVSKVIEKTTNESMETINKVTQNLSSMGETSQKQIETMNNLSKNVFEQTKEVLAFIKQEMNSISASPKDFQNNLEEFNKTLSLIKNAFTDNNYKDVTNGLKDLSSAINNTKAVLDKTSDSVNLISKNSTTLKVNLDSIENVTEEFSEELAKATKSLRSNKKR
jgi:methyl-accepting chemotaxis protein